MLVLVTPPSSLPVYNYEAEEYLRLTDNSQSQVLEILIEAATKYLDGPAGVLGRALVTQTYDLVLDRFPPGREPICLDLPPVQSVVSPIAYLDANGAQQGLTSFVVDLVGGRIVPAWGTTWPATREMPNAVTVRFTTGVAASQVSQADRLLVLALVAHYFENREPVVVGNVTAEPVPEHLAQLIAARRRITVG